MKVALYARYSTDHQRDASIEDQLRLCRLHAEKLGWTIVDSYTDRAISGASLLRPGVQELIQDATRGRFAVVLAEAMDRLSRDQEDIAGLFKRMSFAGVRIVTLSEGDVTHLHVGLKGTMNALFLKDQYKAINYLKGNNTGEDMQQELVSHNIGDYTQRIDNDPDRKSTRLNSSHRR